MYIPVVGLEIHVQANTKSKMFCRCSTNYFHKAPNSNICPVCFGLPGALPIPNKMALFKTIKLALALNCEIAEESKFDRKNYFYPDLPKGYQISQFDKPIGTNGFVEFEIGDDARRVRIERIHLEEDTAKSMHTDGGDTFIDFNKSSIPLMEIVTKPDFTDVEEVTAFAKRLRQIVRYTDTSGAEMQKGQMRFELNISVKKTEEVGLPNYKVEIKNIGSISVLEKVLRYEFERQSKLLESGAVIKPHTRGLKGMSGETLFQRSKETADDYRYFPEPDIPPFKIEKTYIASVKETIEELPVDKKRKYIDLGLEIEQADIFIEDLDRGTYFDSVLKAKDSIDKNFVRLIANWINSDLAGLLEKKKMNFADSPVTAKDLIYMESLFTKNKITGAIVKKVMSLQFMTSDSANEIIQNQNLMQVDNENEISAFIKKVIESNPKVVKDVSKNPNAIKFLVGQVMRESKGKANPKIVEKLLNQKLL